MSPGSRRVYALYTRYGEQVMEIIHRSSGCLTAEECRSIWDAVWKEVMGRKRELSALKGEEEIQIWLLTIVKRNLKENDRKI